MHRQVSVVAILMIIQGSLEIIMGGVYAAMGPLIMTLMQSAPRSATAPDEAMMTGMSIVYLLLGLAAVGAGIFQIVAGIRALKYRGRVMSIVAVSLNLLAFGTCYCVPTALGVMIYGLIVFLNQQTARAFALGAQGNMSADEIKAQVDAEMRGGFAPQQAYAQQPQAPYGQQPPPPPPPPGYGGPPGFGGPGGGGPGAPPGY